MDDGVFKVESMHLAKRQGAIRAFASISVADVFIIKNLKVMEGKKGLFVSMPAQKVVDPTSQETKYIDTAFPRTQEAHAQLQEVVIHEYLRTNAAR